MPGRLVVAPDATRLFVLDLETPRATEVGLHRMERLGVLDFASRASAPPRVSGQAGGLLGLAARGGGLAVYDLGARAFAGSIHGGGPVGDFHVAPGGRLALLSLGLGDRGAIELLDLERWESREVVDLPGAPVAGTLTFSPHGDRGAVLVSRDGGRARSAVCWSTGAFRILASIPVEPDAACLAFGAGGSQLAVAHPGSAEVVLLDPAARREGRRIAMVGRPFGLESDPSGRALWVLCRDVGHVAVIDPDAGRVRSRVLLEGADPAMSRIRFSPEGRLAMVSEGERGGLVLLEADPESPGCGLLLDRLDLCRPIGSLEWSPLGDEVFVVDGPGGCVVAIDVHRGARRLKDTDQYLLEHLKAKRELERRQNPLFPP
jgi:DNA-binding beta-propeller fold protein YncE